MPPGGEELLVVAILIQTVEGEEVDVVHLQEGEAAGNIRITTLQTKTLTPPSHLFSSSSMNFSLVS